MSSFSSSLSVLLFGQLFDFISAILRVFVLYSHYSDSISSKKPNRHQAIGSMSLLGPVHMIPGQLIAPGQLTDLWVNFASVHGLTHATVHMSFSLPPGNFERRVTRCTTPGNPPCRGNFSPCEQNAKVAPGQE